MSRPEHTAPPEIFYNDDEAKKYTVNTRIQTIQAELTYRAMELLNLENDVPKYLLDIGCGSGLSGDCLSEDGHIWVGLDISDAMLGVARERESEGDLYWSDIGQGVFFRPGTFDGCISISVIQWLCNADRSSHVPKKRLLRFFQTLYTAMARGARCVFQFYPENSDQVEMIVTQAMKAGFTGGIVVDFPNSTKAKKYFLCLFAGFQNDPANAPKLPEGLAEEEDPANVLYTSKRMHDRRKGKKANIKDKNWIQRKKELGRIRGKKVANDSKYTGRKRGPKF
ncbi:S-adenosyl-L-methionine-dependent methyltransferase [Polychytrium aggregatum]|uniref:S-adenosyl-L-methionine-dependent methyltransferase n=1 Tax=Polychytrium aggregatum TaxID=110093 RepID=UPI0022FF2369|nr:S-adenosyl-L-methionine-dependent methyltransferase [Polychytrium aggregatum]KAI9208954.1 S-adenosyl-L-methionine-dependent methyltransferase [Polychytrium aggregatum]